MNKQLETKKGFKNNLKSRLKRKTMVFWFYVGRGLSVFCWLLLLVAIVISFYAAPEKNYGLLRHHQIDVRNLWQFPLTQYLMMTLMISSVLCIAALYIRKFQSRLATHNPQYNLFILLIINGIWLVFIVTQQ